MSLMVEEESGEGCIRESRESITLAKEEKVNKFQKRDNLLATFSDNNVLSYL